MPSTSLTPSDYVVLGMVGLGARSGYEITRTVEHSIRFFWTISPAQVYPSLAKLQRAGLLIGRRGLLRHRPSSIPQGVARAVRSVQW